MLFTHYRDNHRMVPDGTGSVLLSKLPPELEEVARRIYQDRHKKASAFYKGVWTLFERMGSDTYCSDYCESRAFIRNWK